MGSLIEWDCTNSKSTIGLYNNIVTENTFIGKLGALFYINGGIAKVIGNSFNYNGKLTTKDESKNPNEYKREYNAYFPFEEYIFSLAQASGIFTFEFDHHDMPERKAHIISNNIFRHIYCIQGCAYSARGDKI